MLLEVGQLGDVGDQVMIRLEGHTRARWDIEGRHVSLLSLSQRRPGIQGKRAGEGPD